MTIVARTRITQTLGRQSFRGIHPAFGDVVLRLVDEFTILGAGQYERDTTFNGRVRDWRGFPRDTVVLPVLDAGWDDAAGGRFVITQYQEGPSLHQLVLRNRRPLSPFEAAEILIPLTKAIGRLHQSGIVHARLEPQAVILRQQYAPSSNPVALTDLDVTGRCAAPSRTAGAFTPPERIHGEPVDLYGLCALALFLTDGACGGRQLTEEERAHGPIHPEAPGPWYAMLRQGLAAAPRDRFASARELHDTLVTFGAQVRSTVPVRPYTR